MGEPMLIGVTSRSAWFGKGAARRLRSSGLPGSNEAFVWLRLHLAEVGGGMRDPGVTLRKPAEGRRSDGPCPWNVDV